VIWKAKHGLKFCYGGKRSPQLLVEFLEERKPLIPAKSDSLTENRIIEERKPVLNLIFLIS